MKRAKLLIVFLLFFQVSAQTKADLQILAEVNQIKAIENHSPVEGITGENEINEEGDGYPAWILDQTSNVWVKNWKSGNLPPKD